jgi:hypothetical protein
VVGEAADGDEALSLPPRTPTASIAVLDALSSTSLRPRRKMG